MNVRLVLKDGTLTARLSGEIDHHSAQAVRENIDETAGKTKPKRLILDFAHVTFMDSSGIGLIMGRYKLMQLLGGALVIANLPPKIEKVVSLAGLDRLAKFEKDVVYDETDE
ncbi:MAG TPA: anti-anti-sigma factor [Ruminococcaceae bacterium]|jgi:stage II sporulation protein AA (anti-sigma F factor antagonist)|nr:anti-anti-sigma factor [Oscillospiraceae bacterium]